MMDKNCLNSSGTVSRGSSSVGISIAETYPRNWAFGSAKMVSSRDNEKSCTADLVQLCKQRGLLNCSSAESQAPWGGVFGDPPEWEKHIHVGFQRGYLKGFLRVVLSVL